MRQLLRKWILSARARRAGFQYRAYQMEASVRCWNFLRTGRNVILPLPTGTGKTLISNLIARHWVEQSPHSRALVILPRRVLVSQHMAYADWMADHVDFYHLSDYSVQNASRFAANSSKSKILFSTPDLFANKVDSGLIASTVQKSIDLVIVDEFDEFLIPEYSATGCDCRFDSSFQRCLDRLPRRTFLLMSATSPLLADDFPSNGEVKAASEKIKSEFKPRIVNVSPSNYRKHVPVTRLELRDVRDPAAEILDRAVGDEISMLFSVLEEFHTGPVDRAWALIRVDGLAEGRITRVRNASGGMKFIGKSLTELFERIRHFHFLRSYVYEDLCAGLYGESVDYAIVKDPVSRKELLFKNRVRLRGLKPNFEHHASLGGKAEALLALSKPKENLVMMFRYIRLLSAIGERLERKNIKFAVLHGKMNDREREDSLRAFRNGKVPLLLMTRDTGKRGLDLPQAQGAVFYSPKASETSTFQEASRIRSTTANIKTCYMLCYGRTDEREKLIRLIQQIKLRSDRDYRISDPCRLLLADNGSAART